MFSYILTIQQNCSFNINIYNLDENHTLESIELLENIWHIEEKENQDTAGINRSISTNIVQPQLMSPDQVQHLNRATSSSGSVVLNKTEAKHLPQNTNPENITSSLVQSDQTESMKKENIRMFSYPDSGVSTTPKTLQSTSSSGILNARVGNTTDEKMSIMQIYGPISSDYVEVGEKPRYRLHLTIKVSVIHLLFHFHYC